MKKKGGLTIFQFLQVDRDGRGRRLVAGFIFFVGWVHWFLFFFSLSKIIVLGLGLNARRKARVGFCI